MRNDVYLWLEREAETVTVNKVRCVMTLMTLRSGRNVQYVA